MTHSSAWIAHDACEDAHLKIADLQDLREKIDQHYRVRLILDNLPITTYDLEENPESIRPGYEIGFTVDGKYYLNNHLMFKILVHKTNGQYSKARQDMAELEAAAVVEVCSQLLCIPCLCSVQVLHLSPVQRTFLTSRCLAWACMQVWERGCIATFFPDLQHDLPNFYMLCIRAAYVGRHCRHGILSVPQD